MDSSAETPLRDCHAAFERQDMDAFPALPTDDFRDGLIARVTNRYDLRDRIRQVSA